MSGSHLFIFICSRQITISFILLRSKQLLWDKVMSLYLFWQGACGD